LAKSDSWQSEMFFKISAGALWTVSRSMGMEQVIESIILILRARRNG
jgi:hypothetical protein